MVSLCKSVQPPHTWGPTLTAGESDIFVSLFPKIKALPGVVLPLSLKQLEQGSMHTLAMNAEGTVMDHRVISLQK